MNRIGNRFFQFAKVTSRSSGGVLLRALVFILILSGCSNKFLSSANLGGSTFITATSGSTTTLNMVGNVVIANNDPNSFQLIETDGAGTIGTNCNPSTNCACTFTYQDTSGNTETTNGPISTIYLENNLLQCSFGVVPSNVSSITVSIDFITLGINSNTTTINLSNRSTFLNPTAISSFVKASRYECKDSVVVPNQFDPGIIDELQSEGPAISYPLNYYTSNFGEALSAFVGGANSANWNCGTNIDSGQTLTIYSQSGIAAGNDPIPNNSSTPVACDGTNNCVMSSPVAVLAPTSTNFDRSTFYLASAPSGIFTVPVNSYIAPNVNSSLTVGATLASGQTPPLGYGAPSVPNTLTNQETCPSSATNPIPAGYQYVKIWLYRATLPVRTYKTSSVFQNTAVYCNGGQYPGTSDVIFNDCNSGSVSGTGHWLTDNNVVLADRIVFPNGGGTTSQVCFSLMNITTPAGNACGGTADTYGSGCTYDTSSVPPANYGGYANLGVGTDIWNFWDGTATDSTPDPFQFKHITGAASLNPATSGAGNTYGVGFDNALTSTNIDSTTRYDFLFVVTPADVYASDLENSSSNAYKMYTPVRFQSATYCSGDDPTVCAGASSAAANAEVTYDITLYDVSTNGDPEPGTTTTGVFPVCAIAPVTP